MNTKKTFSVIIITLLFLNLSLAADGFSVKLRGKLALAGVLSGVAFLTYTLVKHDRDVSETLLSQLGRPEYIVKIDRGFDTWYVHQFRKQSYHFLNNRYIKNRPNNTFLEFLREGRFGSGFSLGYMNRKDSNPFLSY